MDGTGLFGDNLEIGTALYKAVGHMDATSNLNMSKMKEISDFFENRPGGAFEINGVIGKKTNQDISNLDHLFAYVSLNNRKADILKTLEALEKELKHYA
jgi:hypothetical protein